MPNNLKPTVEDHTVESLLLGGRVRLLQPKIGYRAGMDAALLAAAVHGQPNERLLEAGCGPGAALLQAAHRAPEAQFLGVERDDAALDLARRNITSNRMETRVEVLGGDVQAGFKSLLRPPFQAVFANPPFFDDPEGLRGPHPAKRGAWLADGGLEAWIGFMMKAAADGGRLILIHRADRLADLLALLGAGASSFRIRPIQSFSDKPAKRVLIKAVKGGRAPLVLLPSLIMHQSTGRSSPEAEAILRGEAGVSWE